MIIKYVNMLWISIYHPILTMYLYLIQIPIIIVKPKLILIICCVKIETFFKFFRIKSERKTIQHPKENLIYGETTYLALERIMTLISPTKNAIFVDCGSGSGKCLFYIHERFNIECIGLEIMKTHVYIVNKIITIFKFNAISCYFFDFINDDLCTMINNHSKKATHNQDLIIFIAGTCFTDASIHKLTTQCAQLRKGTHIITTSYPLKHTNIKELHCFSTWFDWGKGHIYIQKVN